MLKRNKSIGDLANPKGAVKVVLLGATFGTSNMGVGALTAGTIRSILHRFFDAEIYLLDYGKESIEHSFKSNGRDVVVRLLNMRFSKKFYLRNNIVMMILFALIMRIPLLRGLKIKIISKDFNLDHICKADIIASIAGGDSFSDIYGLGRFFYVALPQVLVLLLGKELVLLPQTIGPFHKWIAKWVGAHILRRASLIFSRDYEGLEEVRKILGLSLAPPKVKICYDMGFAMEVVRADTQEVKDALSLKKEGERLVGLNVSGLLFMGGYTRSNQFGLKTDYRLLIDSLIGHLIEKKNNVVLLVPHVFGKGEKSESDQAVCERVYQSLKPKYKERLCLAKERYNQNEIKYVIGLCDFFIGSRMHACIAAISQQIPTVSIAYSKKFIGVMETVGMQSYIADPRTMTKEEMFKVVEKMFDDEDQIRQHLKQKMPEVTEKVLNLFKEINKIIKHGN